MGDETKVLSLDELEAQMKDAAGKGDWAAVRKIAKELENVEKAQAIAEREAKERALANTTLTVKKKIDAIVEKMKDAGELDIADGVWYANDFGSTDTSCRLMKSAVRKSSGGGGKSSYVANDAKTSDLLAQVGDNVMFATDTEVTIDKQKITMAAGTTFKTAHEFSNNGGWRNRVRMALLKEAGLV